MVVENLLLRQNAAQDEISSYETILKTYVANAETKLANDLTTASQAYSNAINAYIVEAAEEGKLVFYTITELNIVFPGKDISKCVSVTETAFGKLTTSALAEVEAKIKTISENAETKLDAVSTALDAATTKINALAGDVEDCSTNDCATQLNSDLVQLYELAISDIDSAIFKALEYILNYAPTNLDSYVLDQTAFEESYASLIDYVAACLTS